MNRLRLAGTLDQTTIAVVADHGFRWGGRERDSRHVPFIVKRAGQTTRVDATPRSEEDYCFGVSSSAARADTVSARPSTQPRASCAVMSGWSGVIEM